MRTTVTIDDRLLADAKVLAARTSRSLGAIVDEALRLLLAAPADPARIATPLPVDGRSGLRPGVDLEDREALAELLDGDAGDSRAAS